MILSAMSPSLRIRVIALVLRLFSIIVDDKAIMKEVISVEDSSCAVFDSGKTRDPFLLFPSRHFARIIDKQQEYLDSRDNGK